MSGIQAILVIFAMVTAPATAVAQADTVLEVTALTDKSSYYPGEPVQIGVRACNPLSEPHTQTMSCGTCVDQGCFCCSRLLIVDSQGAEVAYLLLPPYACPGGPIDFSFVANECKQTNVAWQQLEGGFSGFSGSLGAGERVAPGFYRVRVEWTHDGPVFESALFEITAAQPSPPVPASTWTGIAILILVIAGAGVALRARQAG